MTCVFVQCALSPSYNRADNKAKGEEAKVDLELWDQNQVIYPYVSRAATITLVLNKMVLVTYI